MLAFDIAPDVTKSTRFANMLRSGSAIEIKKPRTSPAVPTIHILLLLAMVLPSNPPIGLMPISMPNKNTDNPIIMKNAPRRNFNNILGSRGVIVKCNNRTIIVIGRTEYKTSFSFSVNTFK